LTVDHPKEVVNLAAALSDLKLYARNLATDSLWKLIAQPFAMHLQKTLTSSTGFTHYSSHQEQLAPILQMVTG
jgi:hypothetical protein